MKTTPTDGGPAFPASPTYGPNGDLYRPADIGQSGMTLRDWFAGQALAGLCANSTWLNNVRAKGHDSCSTAAGAAYEAADKMLAAREAKGNAS